MTTKALSLLRSEIAAMEAVVKAAQDIELWFSRAPWQYFSAGQRKAMEDLIAAVKAYQERER